jgi:uracil-DNA glycosylase
VRCVPPANKPVGSEIGTCRSFLAAEIAAMDRLEAIVALGLVAHKAVLAALGLRQSHVKFAHGAQHALPNDLTLADSYHCSRYNTNTGRLTEEMFHAVFDGVRSLLANSPAG